MIPGFLRFGLAGVACLAGGAGGVWIVSLIANDRIQKKRICELTHDKGALTMRVSILEDILKEKGLGEKL